MLGAEERQVVPCGARHLLNAMTDVPHPSLSLDVVYNE
jgi:hypothetical protein